MQSIHSSANSISRKAAGQRICTREPVEQHSRPTLLRTRLCTCMLTHNNMCVSTVHVVLGMHPFMPPCTGCKQESFAARESQFFFKAMNALKRLNYAEIIEFTKSFNPRQKTCSRNHFDYLREHAEQRHPCKILPTRSGLNKFASW